MKSYSDGEGLYSEFKEAATTKRRGINSVETGMRILECIIELGCASSLKIIADRAGMDSSQAYRYVASLLNSGMLVQDPRTSFYDLGPTALKVGLAAIARLDEFSILENRMQEFSVENRATCMLSVWASHGPTIIRWFHGKPPVFTTLAVGSALPITSSATGQIFLAFLTESLLETQLLIEGHELPLDENKNLMDLKMKVRNLMIASIDSKFIPGLKAHSAPVFGIQNTLIGAFTVIANDAMRKRDFNALKHKLLVCCSELSRDLGGDWPEGGWH